MTRLYALAGALAALALILAACGGGNDGNGDNESSMNGERPTPLTENESDLQPIPANSELVVGPNRFALGLIDTETTEPITQTTGVQLRFYYESELRQEMPARWVWAIPDEQGFYVADVEFDTAGQWEAEAVVTREGEESSVRFSFPVQEEGFVPNIGEEAVPTDNLTLDDADFARLSTDENPEPALYEMTVTEALEAGEPLVLVFATPAFCQTRFCGPVVDNVRHVWEQYNDRANFIHIEPFQLDEEGSLITDETGAPVPAQPTTDWNLRTEPWVFVIDGEGEITDRFEGTVTAEELSSALEDVLA